MLPDIPDNVSHALSMFVLLAVELTVLFLVVSFVVGMLQSYLSPEKIRHILSAKQGRGYWLAAMFGAITPFCSCSTIPFLKGLLRAQAGFGPMMVFLFASPLLNPIIIGLFVVTFGWQVAMLYFAVALMVSIGAGILLEYFGFEQYVRKEAYQSDAPSCGTESFSQQGGCGRASQENESALSGNCGEVKGPSLEPKPAPSRWKTVWWGTWKDFRKVLPYLLLGISVGSLIYGFVPTELITRLAGGEVWYAIPLAAVIGIPLYIRAEAVIPLSAALVKKGMAMGSVMALIIGSAGASITEVILLKALFRTPLIIAFLSVILMMAMSAGWLYGSLF